MNAADLVLLDKAVLARVQMRILYTAKQRTTSKLPEKISHFSIIVTLLLHNNGRKEMRQNALQSNQ